MTKKQDDVNTMFPLLLPWVGGLRTRSDDVETHWELSCYSDKGVGSRIAIPLRDSLLLVAILQYAVTQVLLRPGMTLDLI